MPEQTQQAIEWALQQSIEVDGFVNRVKDEGSENINHQLLVDYVRKYFNDNNIEYGTFSFDDLKPYL